MKKIGPIVLSSLLSFSCFAQELPQNIQALEEELTQLQKQLHDARLKEMQEEIGSQRLMFEEWGKYADHMKKAEKFSDEAAQIEKQIKQLNSQKKHLLNAATDNQNSYE